MGFGAIAIAAGASVDEADEAVGFASTFAGAWGGEACLAAALNDFGGGRPVNSPYEADPGTSSLPATLPTEGGGSPSFLRSIVNCIAHDGDVFFHRTFLICGYLFSFEILSASKSDVVLGRVDATVAHM
ncbi:hypothetical protein GYMLUDRAFT_997141 [Collybiopsis luxurians FD-317 M1]|uniref:Uncharacterized protein n=1 Tax=Collybiopsis luxurians FD-317 M1 TaxID=944289 RepID=A0A0D0CYD5_9AGAR|nr:hypothetical protein GYMLUDRAFT_997141 [Collybiopsis luxurians FD-317 M1]